VKPRRIIFTRPLIEKIRRGEAQCTYRREPKQGLFEVYQGPWMKAKPTGILIEFYSSEQVHLGILTDADAQAAGVKDAETLRRLLERWYGKLPQTMWRNWFKVQQQDPGARPQAP